MSAVGRHFASRASDSHQPGAFGRAVAEDGGGLGHGFDGLDPVFRDAVQTPRERLLGRDHDPLRDEGLAYADELAAASVDVFAKNYPGMIHTFASLYAISGGADQALGELLKEFRHRALVPRSTREAATDLHSPRP
ncbi:MAG: acetyl esterase [Mycobacterium sp.]|jgi:acetyl esterase/lipase|uniref:alpha/beta hydrolase fold domain-containing protein n=1 Tax=Mycobacterium sp. TaxID=1785 RepID=UPI0028B40D0C|nr:Carboxylesterase NlhH [Mycobacterium sp.]MDT5055885.1 acetyl esterase [Mycobacterium sp.]